MKDVLDECFGESPKLFHRIESTNIFLYYHDSLVACSKVKKAQFDQMENVDLKFRLSAQSKEKHNCSFCFAFLPYLEDNDNLLKRNHDSMKVLLDDHSRGTSSSSTLPFYTPYHFYGTIPKMYGPSDLLIHSINFFSMTLSTQPWLAVIFLLTNLNFPNCMGLTGMCTSSEVHQT